MADLTRLRKVCLRGMKMKRDMERALPDVRFRPVPDIRAGLYVRREETAMPKRYEVTGTDDLGDEHIFRTDDRERAEGVAAAMREDLENVELVEKA